jgi:Leu/Phe-tRNA-protein transferase
MKSAEFSQNFYPLRYTKEGMIFMHPGDDCDAVVDAMLGTGYSEEFCIALDWNLDFIARLMKAGFLVMSDSFDDEDSEGKLFRRDIILPKLHLVRSVLFFPELHVKRSIRPQLKRYELRFDVDFETILQKCLDTHGDGWLTSSLVKALFALRKQRAGVRRSFSLESARTLPRPVSFGLYREGRLVAGEFGIICGRVYTSYSGYREENNSGTVQMILMVRLLLEAGFDFFDFGMPLPYKADLGARDIAPEEFVKIFRAAQC